MSNNVTIQFGSFFTSRLLALWRYKGFVFGMVWREFRGRYLGSLLGGIWSVIHPMVMVFIYTVIFSQIMRAKLVGVDNTMGYGMFLCAGLLPWGFFSELLSRSQYVFIEQGNLLKKVSFPRITLPMVLLFSSAVNFIIIFGIFLVFLLIFARFPGWVLLAFIPLLLIQQVLALGLGMLFGTLNVFFRDAGQLVGIGLQFWFWLTPIVYPMTILPERVRPVIGLNPLTKLVGAYQQIILHGHWPQWREFLFHSMSGLIALAVGFFVFQRLSDAMVDEL